MLLPLLIACATPPAAPPAPEPAAPAETARPIIRFQAAAPREGAEGQVLASATYAGQPLPFDWHVLLREGSSYGDLPFGTVVDRLGRPLPEGKTGTCGSPDFNGLFDAFGATWLLTHLECAPAALWLSRLERVEGGGFTVASARPLDLSAVGGANNLCAGSLTPWGTALSGEEYETNAALVQDGQIITPVPGLAAGRSYADWSSYPDFARYMAGEPTSPYRNGWMVETKLLTAAGDVSVVKHGAMGRFSHETGAVMPDRRTVYLSDDQSHAIFGMFVADQPGDLSAGTLYAARWSGTERDMSLSWVSLGHATDAQVSAAIDAGVSFDQLFEHSAPTEQGCPEGLTLVRGSQYVDGCLKVKPGQEALASRLETRRAAALLGATVELHKSEGLAFDPEGRTLYLATTRIGGGMLLGEPPNADGLALAENPCGAVWAFELAGDATDTAGAPIDSPWVARRARVAVAGEPDGNGCSPTSISEPDNIAFMAGHGVLLIGEDTDRAPNKLWAWQDGALVPIYAAPGFPDHPGEVTGLQWVPDAGGAAWITVSVQRPGGQPAISGVLGPFPTPATAP